MDDVNKTDSDYTRPSKRIKPDEDDQTRAVRPPGDSENTIPSQRKPVPAKPVPPPPSELKETQIGQPVSPSTGAPSTDAPSTGPSTSSGGGQQSSPQPEPPSTGSGQASTGSPSTGSGRGQQPPPSALKETQPGESAPYRYQSRQKPVPPETPRRDRQRTPVASQQPTYYSPGRRHTPPPPGDPYRTAVAGARPPFPPDQNRRSGFTRVVAVLALLSALVMVLLLAGGLITYVWIASQLPPAEELRSRSAQFATTRILDREGNLLWEIIDPTGGRRTTVTLDQVSPDLANATIATEDRFFYLNVGVDPIAIGRALYYNLTEGEIVSGASTITQQLARNVLLTPEERTEQSLSRKIREAVLAVEINRRYTKTQILEIYLNQIYYGNLAYGIEAASQTYFGKSARNLTLAEASLLAGLPQSPAIHDPYVNPDGAKARQSDVLGLMVEANYITPAEAEAAKLEDLTLRPLGVAFEAPHFVNYVRQELETIVPPEYIYQAGLTVQTTLNPRLQTIAEDEVRNQINSLRDRNVNNGALVAMDTATGQILAMVGSKDFQDESIDGQINMATSPRQPGSTIKPLTYLAAFELLNWTPSSLLMDVPVEYSDGAGGVYRPVNYDEKFRGPVSVRTALAQSLNIPAVKALGAIGVDSLKEMARRLGVTTLTRDDYGLALTLGGGEVPLVEMTGAYQAMANKGMLAPPTAILQITDAFGRVIEPARPQARQALREEHAYLMTHILSDNEARAAGANNPLNLSRPAAAKTGTTNDFRDNWTIGYTPDIVAGVWVGNADYTPMVNVTGLTGAAPIWHNFMERAHEGLPLHDFTRPSTIIELEVCADSGTIPSPVCPQRRREIFFQGQPPLGAENDIHQLIAIDRNTGLRANEFCRANVEERYYRVYPPDGREWAIRQGIEQPPEGFCPSTNIIAGITSPLDGSTVRGLVNLEGSATAANFAGYQIELGQGTEPQAFTVIQERVGRLVEGGTLGSFDTTLLENGPYTLRLVVFDQTGGASESRVRVLVDNPPAPTVTFTPEPSATATDTPVPATATAAPLPTDTPTVVLPTATQVVVDTPTATPSPTTQLPEPAPTETATLVPPATSPSLPTDTPTLEATGESLEAGASTPTP